MEYEGEGLEGLEGVIYRSTWRMSGAMFSSWDESRNGMPFLASSSSVAITRSSLPFDRLLKTRAGALPNVNDENGNARDLPIIA